MAVYTEDIEMVQEMIAEDGQAVTWRKIVNGTPADPSKPWLVDSSETEDFPVNIVFLPSDRENKQFVKYLTGTTIKTGELIGLMGQVSGFVPKAKDVIIRGNVEYIIETIDTVEPNDEGVILYTFELGAGETHLIEPPVATGGLKTIFGAYTIHAFLSDADFIPENNFDVDVLVVGGGAAGGDTQISQRGGGGGGAGGLQWTTGHEVTPSTMPVVIGEGGVGTNHTIPGGSGGSSIFDSITSNGGGGGAGGNRPQNGAAGASGGGGGWFDGNGGAGTAGQGFAGATPISSGNVGGGGGGASETPANTGIGGDGLDFSALLGTAYGDSGWFSGGGGGGDVDTSHPGGSGGGGAGSNASGSVATSAIANSGGGGGGGYTENPHGEPGLGGSGIVLIRYLTNG